MSSFLENVTSSARQYTVGPNASNEITPQAIVSNKFFVDARMWQERKGAAADPNNHMGIPEGVGDVAVKPNEFFFTYSNGRGLFRPKDPRISSGGTGFTSFSGLPLPRHVQSDEDLLEFVHFQGVSATQAHLSAKSTSGNSGVTVHVRGSGTVLNTGPDILYPGDVVGYELPSIFHNKRKMQRLRYKGFGQIPKGKHLAVPVRMHYSQIVKWAENTTRNLIENSDILNIPDYRNDSNTNYSATDEISIMTKQMHSFIAYNALMAFVQMGIVRPAYNIDIVKPASTRAGWLALKEKRSFLPNEWHTRRLNVENNFVDIETREEQRQYRLKIQEFAEYTAGLLGLVQSDTRSYIKEDISLNKYMLMRSYYSLINDSSVLKLASIKNDFVAEAKRRNALGDILHKLTIAGQMTDIQTSAASSLARAFGYTYDMTMKRSIGNCSNVAVRNGPIHLVIG